MQTSLIVLFALTVSVAFCNRVKTGGWTTKDAADPGIVKVFSSVLPELTEDSSFHNKMEIVRARSQVVSGMKYEIEYSMVPTTCKEGTQYVEANCNVEETAKHRHCKVVIWTRPWLNSTQILRRECSSAIE